MFNIWDWDNLWLAFRQAAIGKHGKGAVATFSHRLADQLIELQDSLKAKTYRPGGYRQFYIYEPKRRRISAAPFRDRVVHHALCNLIEPVFEAQFIADSYANRIGKGTHRAIDRLQYFAQHYRYALRADIVQHFPSLDHAILRARLLRGLTLASPGTLNVDEVMWLIDQVLASSASLLANDYTPIVFPGDSLSDLLRPRGLPIGNLTSQFWSNIYLSDFDWFVLRRLRCPAYVRYVDDFVLFSNSKHDLLAYRTAIMTQLAQLRLTLHENEAEIYPTQHGLPWLGFVVYPSHRLLKRRNVIKFAQRLEQNLDLYGTRQISFGELDASVNGWINHVRFADTWGLRKHIFRTRPIPPRKLSDIF